ncbi:MAG: SPASM domain-containing protein [Candidatus Riflebacteria bacterium]|nr:SPASM domain-containing protein [Candidatus Riflebacteria bacterium]
MKKSAYNIWINDDSNDSLLLYNTLYGSLSSWDITSAELVRKIFENPEYKDESVMQIYSALCEQNNLVADHIDEFEIIRNRKIEGVKDRNRLDVVIMPTLNCNFSCVYCFEKPRISSMSAEMVSATDTFVENMIPDFKLLVLHWYGGEPLLESDVVINLTKRISRVARKHNVFTVTHITTNGYCIDQIVADNLFTCGITEFQITVDGSQYFHDRLRLLKGGGDTFNRITENICMLAALDASVKITLRVNFNAENITSIPELLESFPRQIRLQLRVMFVPIFGKCSSSMEEDLPSEKAADLTCEYYSLAAEHGYDVSLAAAGLRSGRLNYCYAERENQYIINYNGDVFKCSADTFQSENRFGWINSEGSFIKDEKKWENWLNAARNFPERCLSCVYLPTCMGGCRKADANSKSKTRHCRNVADKLSVFLRKAEQFSVV